MGRELELKFSCPEEKFSALSEEFGPFREIAMETAYYDTRDLSLGAKRWMLRLRRENGLSLATLKTPLPDGSRGEWETPADRWQEALPGLLAQGAPEELLKIGPEDLVQVCAARFTRLCRDLSYPGGIAELALDRGWLLAGDNREPIRELELELKEGSDGAFHRFAAQLQQAYALQEEPSSKYKRALALREG